ncbi:YiiX/YebB-like N1pC/P60 family cysteine hydrolase [Novosphingobium sp.]|uniref:YiiX/YebB-like N1pC/P60 family cysteine hydrolase n=1 Tax=Novosphingobium sp. TaxID=1874826 RepID=UPI002732C20C|nr:YiiX/YebB-like N1pC/P60 family cysteine hydrolase [Novosphingobium sp.]MDP3906733.1 YiiX/YebB-like N1pC/P60 family cysteine hydrolase [Novosphingobium sp.]
MGLLLWVGRQLAGFLTGPSRAPYANAPTDPEVLRRIIQPGDVLLVDGRQRISTAIKYLTQSTWSHAALCISAADGSSDASPQFVEADAVDGVRVVSLAEFAGLHTRICRPIGLTEKDISVVVDFALGHVGDEYDLANVVDLARYLCPTPPVPSSWRRRMIALGSGEPTKAICSTLVAQAFQSIRYPILPQITRELVEDPDCQGCVRDILHIRHHSLFTPRDFDVSPYFDIVKPTVAGGFDHRALSWDDRLPLSISAA